MAERDRMFVGCKCSNRELSMPDMIDERGFFKSALQCATCYEIVELCVRREPDWPILLRGL